MRRLKRVRLVGAPGPNARGAGSRSPARRALQRPPRGEARGSRQWPGGAHAEHPCRERRGRVVSAACGHWESRCRCPGLDAARSLQTLTGHRASPACAGVPREWGAHRASPVLAGAERPRQVCRRPELVLGARPQRVSASQGPRVCVCVSVCVRGPGHLTFQVPPSPTPPTKPQGSPGPGCLPAGQCATATRVKVKPEAPPAAVSAWTQLGLCGGPGGGAHAGPDPGRPGGWDSRQP